MSYRSGFSLRPAFGAVAAALFLTIVSLGLQTEVRAEDRAVMLRIGGTGTALGGMRLLASAFKEVRPDVRVIVLPSLGSGGGIKALAAGKIDMSVSARQLKQAERAKGLKASEYVRTPIVFATRYDNPAENLTLDDAAAMYSGEKESWPDGTQVRLILRPATETDIKLLRGMSKAMDKAVEAALQRDELHVAINDQDNATALEKVRGSLGIAALGQIKAEKRRVKPLALDGVQGTPANLKSSKYPFAKTLYLVLKPEPAPAVEAFVRFIKSPEGRAVLTSTDHIVTLGAAKPEM